MERWREREAYISRDGESETERCIDGERERERETATDGKIFIETNRS